MRFSSNNCKHEHIKMVGNASYCSCLDCYTMVMRTNLKGVYTTSDWVHWKREKDDDKIRGVEAKEITYDG